MILSSLASLALMVYSNPFKKLDELRKLANGFRAMNAHRGHSQIDAIDEELNNDVQLTSKSPVKTKLLDGDYEHDGLRYVYIEGRYYPASPDNIYNINGRRVFYVNKRSVAANKASDKGLPISTSEMIEVLKRTQNNIKSRDQMLENIDEQ